MKKAFKIAASSLIPDYHPYMQNSQSVPALILAGGLGTRLRPVVSDRPKVLAMVGGRPFLSILLDQLLEAGFCHVVLCIGYMGEKICEMFGDRYGAMTIQYSVEPDRRGTAGALHHCLPIIQDANTVLAMNGDSYIEADLAAYMDWYFQQDRSGALLLAHVSHTDRYGSVDMDEEDRITQFLEKEKGTGQGWINAGVYVLRKDLLKNIPPARRFSLERDLFPSLVGKGLYGYRCRGRFIDIGTPESFDAAEAFFSGSSPKELVGT